MPWFQKSLIMLEGNTEIGLNEPRMRKRLARSRLNGRRSPLWSVVHSGRGYSGHSSLMIRKHARKIPAHRSDRESSQCIFEPGISPPGSYHAKPFLGTEHRLDRQFLPQSSYGFVETRPFPPPSRATPHLKTPTPPPTCQNGCLER